ncbi:hypothetical protein QU951_23990 [Escherichia coli]|nr:hypothetical protein [Escherichia coli]
MPAATTGVNLPGNLVEVVPHAGKLTKQRRRERGKLAGAGGFLVQARLAHPGCKLFTVAALMAIDAGLERLRHAVLEKGADDDR